MMKKMKTSPLLLRVLAGGGFAERVLQLLLAPPYLKGVAMTPQKKFIDFYDLDVHANDASRENKVYHCGQKQRGETTCV